MRIFQLTRYLLFTLLALAIVVMGAQLWHKRVWLAQQFPDTKVVPEHKDPRQYPNSMAQIQQSKKNWRAQKIPARQLSGSFTQMFRDDILAYWYGTAWGFYGTSETPQSGTIACGYFVTTTLRDMGVPLNRSALAQKPSEAMIRALVQPAYIQNLSKQTSWELNSVFLSKGTGVYIIGLDTHTGFILVDETGAHFIHSSGAFPYRVIKEPVAQSSILAQSKYRVAGQLTADPQFMQRWLNFQTNPTTP